MEKTFNYFEMKYIIGVGSQNSALCFLKQSVRRIMENDFGREVWKARSQNPIEISHLMVKKNKGKVDLPLLYPQLSSVQRGNREHKLQLCFRLEDQNGSLKIYILYAV